MRKKVEAVNSTRALAELARVVKPKCLYGEKLA